MKKVDIKTAVCLVLATALCIAGLIFAFALVGYSILALLCWGLAALAILYWWLGRQKRKGKRWSGPVRGALTALLLAGAAVLGVAAFFVVRDARTDAPASVDYLIVLGAGVDGTTPSLSLRNRLDAALAYLEDNPETIAVVSGGRGPGEQITEAEAMRLWLEARGVAPARIWLEDQASTTEENLRFSLAMIDNAGAGEKTIAVVSSEYHLCRAKYLAQEAGAEVYGVAGRTTLPVLRINYFLREALAMVYLWIF